MSRTFNLPLLHYHLRPCSDPLVKRFQDPALLAADVAANSVRSAKDILYVLREKEIEEQSGSSDDWMIPNSIKFITSDSLDKLEEAIRDLPTTEEETRLYAEASFRTFAVEHLHLHRERLARYGTLAPEHGLKLLGPGYREGRSEDYEEGRKAGEQEGYEKGFKAAIEAIMKSHPCGHGYVVSIILMKYIYNIDYYCESGSLTISPPISGWPVSGTIGEAEYHPPPSDDKDDSERENYDDNPANSTGGDDGEDYSVDGEFYLCKSAISIDVIGEDNVCQVHGAFISEVSESE